MKWRIWSVIFTVLYTLALLVALPPAGVFTGGAMPLIMLGLADEYARWADDADEAAVQATGTL